MILVAGATGLLGGRICRRLLATRRPVRALVRPTSDATTRDDLVARGAELAYGDLRDRASLDAACRGATTVVSTVTSTRSRQPGDGIEATDHAGQLRLVEAARAAGVARLVFVSYSAQIGVDDPLTVAKRAVERRLRESGMVHTILRPSFFMEVWLGPALGFDHANARATIHGSGQAPVSWISVHDVAGHAVRALDDPAADGATIELGGPQALSQLEVVRIFEEETGRRFDLAFVPEAVLVMQRDAAADSLQRSFAALMLACAAGDAIPVGEFVRRAPFPPTTVRDHARRAAATYRAPDAMEGARERTTH